jgi:hypothetical protein
VYEIKAANKATPNASTIKSSTEGPFARYSDSIFLSRNKQMYHDLRHHHGDLEGFLLLQGFVFAPVFDVFSLRYRRVKTLYRKEAKA